MKERKSCTLCKRDYTTAGDVCYPCDRAAAISHEMLQLAVKEADKRKNRVRKARNNVCMICQTAFFSDHVKGTCSEECEVVARERGQKRSGWSKKSFPLRESA
jgi:hypothetical protein